VSPTEEVQGGPKERKAVVFGDISVLIEKRGHFCLVEEGLDLGKGVVLVAEQFLVLLGFFF
jgi:hypothetical protein